MAQNHWFILLVSQYLYIAVEVTVKLALSLIVDSWVISKERKETVLVGKRSSEMNIAPEITII